MANKEGESIAPWIEMMRDVEINQDVKYLLGADRDGCQTWSDVDNYLQQVANHLSPELVAEVHRKLHEGAQAIRYQEEVKGLLGYNLARTLKARNC